MSRTTIPVTPEEGIQGKKVLHRGGRGAKIFQNYVV
jgi:hypothetical protein